VAKFAVPNVAKILVGTKADLADEDKRNVEPEEADKLARAHHMLQHVEVSSKNNINVDTGFFLYIFC
jgi:hypothetical protein